MATLWCCINCYGHVTLNEVWRQDCYPNTVNLCLGYYTMPCQLLRLCGTEWNIGGMMLNGDWRAYGRKQLWSVWRHNCHLPGGTPRRAARLWPVLKLCNKSGTLLLWQATWSRQCCQCKQCQFNSNRFSKGVLSPYHPACTYKEHCKLFCSICTINNFHTILPTPQHLQLKRWLSPKEYFSAAVFNSWKPNIFFPQMKIFGDTAMTSTPMSLRWLYMFSTHPLL
jgi:hypothetical protein